MVSRPLALWVAIMWVTVSHGGTGEHMSRHHPRLGTVGGAEGNAPLWLGVRFAVCGSRSRILRLCPHLPFHITSFQLRGARVHGKGPPALQLPPHPQEAAPPTPVQNPASLRAAAVPIFAGRPLSSLLSSCALC